MITRRDVNMNPTPERRAMRRFDMRLPAAIRIGDGAQEWLTETQNVSARGLYFYASQAPSPGTRLEVTLTFPPHITSTESVRVRFTAKVVRVEQASSAERVGVAAIIEEYEFLRSLRKQDSGREGGDDWPESN